MMVIEAWEISGPAPTQADMGLDYATTALLCIRWKQPGSSQSKHDQTWPAHDRNDRPIQNSTADDLRAHPAPRGHPPLVCRRHLHRRSNTPPTHQTSRSPR
jgi:hypothetical protein